MLRFLRRPLTWMVVAECMVVGALILVAWHIIAGSGVSPASPIDVPETVASAPSAVPEVPGLATAPPTARGPLPGLNLEIGFWRLRLGALNNDTAAIEALEWKLVHAVMTAVRGYMDTVVLPAIRHAEGGG